MVELTRKFSLIKPFVYLALCGYLGIVVYPMLWLLYTSLKTDREIFLNPFSLPALDDLQWINFTNAWTKGHFGDYFFNSVVLTVATGDMAATSKSLPRKASTA